MRPIGDRHDSYLQLVQRLAFEADALRLALPSRTEADEITAMMLAQVFRNNGRLVKAIPVTSLESEIVDLTELHKPDVICLSATPPAAAMHARYL